MKCQKIIFPIISIFILSFFNCTNTTTLDDTIQTVTSVKINDSFWKPKLDLWQKTTINDVFDKFEGKGQPLQDGKPKNAFVNFDLVAQGERGIGKHYGFPWFDGLVYESISGASGFLAENRDAELEKRIDGYIDRIVAAQATEVDGYVNTYTQLMEPEHKWGRDGGVLRWLHDVYNAGMLIEAGIQYYQATGKTKLLNAAVKYGNCMYNTFGEAPKQNVIPGHAGPEEPIMKLYWLFKDNPELKSKMDTEVNENNYFELATYLIENRGNHCGFPLWNTWGNDSAMRWIQAKEYMAPEFGENSRPSYGSYAQDSIPVLQQKTIEGHAVRATLMATGLTSIAIENKKTEYEETACRLWDNMTGRRMFITGGVGAIAHDEKFGDDYYLPTDAYLETCAAVGVGFFSQRMNQLTGKGKYMDEFERSLYNNILTGISFSGDNYTYVNPLNSEHHHRWGWHDCPCCPPMFLKMMGAMPSFIYSQTSNDIYVNLFVGSEADFKLNGEQSVHLKQTTNYPWDGKITINVTPESKSDFGIKIRIPGWATNKENPFGLYSSNLKEPVSLTVNGEKIDVLPEDGYVTIKNKWNKGDVIKLELPVAPRFVFANSNVDDLKGKVALASGPLVYCLEGNMNPELNELVVDMETPINLTFDSDMLNGVNLITGKAKVGESGSVDFKAIPYFAAGNIQPGNSYKVWIPNNN